VNAPVRLVDVRGSLPSPATLGPVAEHLRAGGVVAHPTETVYGFGGLLTDVALARLRWLKRRERDKPFIMLVPDTESVAGLGWNDAARSLAEVFWPGAVTLVLPDPDRIFPGPVRSGAGAVAVRVSPDPWVRALLDSTAEPLTSSSANTPGGPPARSGSEAARIARSLGAGEEVWVLDAGTLPPSAPSTVIDCTGSLPVVLREGATPLGRLRCVLPEIHGQPHT